MYYSELLSSPISAYNVKRMYGVDPDASPAAARAMRLFPLTPTPEGYTAMGYEKYGDSYRAVLSPVSNADRELLNILKELGPDGLRTALGL